MLRLVKSKSKNMRIVTGNFIYVILIITLRPFVSVQLFPGA